MQCFPLLLSPKRQQQKVLKKKYQYCCENRLGLKEIDSYCESLVELIPFRSKRVGEGIIYLAKNKHGFAYTFQKRDGMHGNCKEQLGRMEEGRYCC